MEEDAVASEDCNSDAHDFFGAATIDFVGGGVDAKAAFCSDPTDAGVGCCCSVLGAATTSTVTAATSWEITSVRGSTGGSPNCLGCWTGEAAITEVFVVEGEPAVGVAGPVEPIVVSVTDDDGASRESKDTSATSLSPGATSASTKAAGSAPFEGTTLGDCEGVRMSNADCMVSCGGYAREDIITPSARDGSRGRLDHMTKLLGDVVL